LALNRSCWQTRQGPTPLFRFRLNGLPGPSPVWLVASIWRARAKMSAAARKQAASATFLRVLRM